MIVTFLEQCEVYIADSFSLLAKDYIVPRTFYPGDEVEIEKFEDSPIPPEIQLFFMDGTVAIVDSDQILVTDVECKDEEE